MLGILILLLVAYIITNYAFKNIILSSRKNKEESFNLLKERNMYSEDKYEKVNYEELEITSEDNLKLKGYYIKNEIKTNKLIILVHGYTANHYMSLQFIDMYLNLGFNILMVDSRSHGSSDGKYVTYGMMESEDLKLWIKLIKGKIGYNVKIGLHGQSMGAATILMYASKYKDIDFIIADCSYSSGREILKYQFKNIVKIPPYPIYQMVNTMIKIRCGFSMNDIMPIKDIQNLKIPILFIHGKEDTIIPYTMSEEMYKIRNNKKDKILIVENADHVESYMKEKESYYNIVEKFINEIT